jgi:hypothetical protein
MRFVTINTGHSVDSPRSDVSGEVIALINRALVGDGTLMGGWSVQAFPARGSARFRMALNDTDVSDCVVCWDESVSAAVWPDATRNMATPPARPAVPWLTAELRIPGILAATPDQMMELGDAERCVAWALIERGWN